MPEDTEEIGFIIRLNDWDAKDIDSDRFVVSSQFEKDENGTIHGPGCPEVIEEWAHVISWVWKGSGT